MSNKAVIALAILVSCPLIIYFLWPSDENRIKKLFKEGARAVEQEKIEEVMSKVSFNYTDNQGLTYIMIKEGVERTFRQMSGIKIEYKIKNISVSDASAVAELDLRVIATYGQETGYIMGDAAKPARMKFYLEKERARWLVNKTEGLLTP